MSGRLILALIGSLDDIKRSQDVIDFIMNSGICEDAVNSSAMVNEPVQGNRLSRFAFERGSRGTRASFP
jgi:hypothetical protein